MKSPKIFVIILNYNGRDTIRACVDSVFKCDYPNLDIVVVDNNSQDGSFEEMRRRFSKVHFIKNSENLGFSAGNNVGIKFALERAADYIFLLNNDAWVQKNTLSNLIRFSLNHPRAGIISPLILKKDGKVWFSGGDIDWMKMRTVHANDKRTESEYVTGCAMLIKKDVFQQAGLFDEDYFLYYEDADFCVRARKADFKVKIDRESIVYHEERSTISNPNKTYWLVLSGLIFFKKNTPWFWRPWIKAYLVLRKRKNKQDIKKNKKTRQALKVQRAYRDFDLL